LRTQISRTKTEGVKETGDMWLKQVVINIYIYMFVCVRVRLNRLILG